MKCICERKCQIEVNGYVTLMHEGDIIDADKCPKLFRPMAGETKEAGPIDFETAKEEELLEAEYELKDLKTFIKEKFDRRAGKKSRSATVKMLLDCRYREL